MRAAGRPEAPLASGFFFCFGRSTVIVAVGVGITIAARAVSGAMVNPQFGVRDGRRDDRDPAAGQLPVPDRPAQPDRAGRHRQVHRRLFVLVWAWR
jgi:hypothetical protein